jgi:hypothetical protein
MAVFGIVYTPLDSSRFEAQAYGRIKNSDTAGFIFIFISDIPEAEREG